MLKVANSWSSRSLRSVSTTTVGCERADPRRDSVRNHHYGVAAEQRTDLGLVGLQLVEGTVERGVLVAGVLQFDDAKRQPVDEDHNIRPALRLVFDHRVLVDG